MKKMCLLLLGISLFLGCNQDDVYDAKTQNEETENNVLKGKTFVVNQEELKKKYAGNQSLHTILENEFKTATGLITTKSEEKQFVRIDLDHIKVFESEEMHTITYHVSIGEEQEDIDGNPLEIYNLMYFSKDYEHYYVVLFRYDFSQISFQEYIKNPGLILNVLGFIPLNDIEDVYENIHYSVSQGLTGTSSVNSIKGEGPFTFINLVDCAVTVVVAGEPCKGEGHQYGEACQMKGNQRATQGYTYTDFSGCGGSSGGGGGGGGSVGSPGGGGGMGSVPIRFPGNFIEIGDVVIIGPGIGQRLTNADWIKKMDQNQDFVTKLNELKTASTLSYESAYSMFNNASSGIHFSPKYDGDPNDLASGGQVALEIDISSTLTSLNCIGFMHCHTNDGNTYNTFSFSDIFAFTQLAYFSTQRQEQLALYLTTLDGGTYVMKMTSKIKMRNLYMKLLIPEDYKYYDDILDKKVDKTHTAEQQTLTFLQFLNKELKNVGLEIYEKNNSGVWEKLTLSSNKKNIVRTGI